MKIQLINGQFTTQETIDLITQMIQVKIKFLENKISNLHNEEDIKSKETKIVKLQNKISELQEYLKLTNYDLKINSEIEINF